MDCRDIKELLSAYIDGALSQEERAQVEEHLKTCKECSESLAALKEAVSQIKGLEEVEPPPLLAKRIMKAIKKEARYPLRIRIPLQAAAMIAIAFTSIYLYKSFQPSSVREAKELPGEYATPQAPSQPPIVVGKAGPTPEKEEAVALRNAPAPAKQEAKIADKRIQVSRAAPAKLKAAAPSVTREERMADAVMKKEPRPMAAAQPKTAAPLVAEAPAIQAPPAAAPAAEVGIMEEKAPQAKKESAGAMRMKAESIYKPTDIRVTIYAKNLDATVREVAKILNQAGATMVKYESFEYKKISISVLPPQDLPKVLEKLKPLGEVKGAESIPAPKEPLVRLIIEMVEQKH